MSSQIVGVGSHFSVVVFLPVPAISYPSLLFVEPSLLWEQELYAAHIVSVNSFLSH